MLLYKVFKHSVLYLPWKELQKTAQFTQLVSDFEFQLHPTASMIECAHNEMKICQAAGRNRKVLQKKETKGKVYVATGAF